MTMLDYHIKLNNADATMCQEWFKHLRGEQNDFSKASEEQDRIYRNYRAWCKRHGVEPEWMPIRNALMDCRFKFEREKFER